MLVPQACPLFFPGCDLGEQLCVLLVFLCTAEYSALLCSCPWLRTLTALGSESRDPSGCGVQTPSLRAPQLACTFPLTPPGLLPFTETSVQSLPVVPCGEVLSAPVSGFT